MIKQFLKDYILLQDILKHFFKKRLYIVAGHVELCCLINQHDHGPKILPPVHRGEESVS